ncbi:unnamed protein product [Caenorhabditis nigoni]
MRRSALKDIAETSFFMLQMTKPRNYRNPDDVIHTVRQSMALRNTCQPSEILSYCITNLLHHLQYTQLFMGQERRRRKKCIRAK